MFLGNGHYPWPWLYYLEGSEFFKITSVIVGLFFLVFIPMDLWLTVLLSEVVDDVSIKVQNMLLLVFCSRLVCGLCGYRDIEGQSQ